LTNKYLGDVPATSRAAKGGSFRREHLSDSNLAHVRALAGIAKRRGQSLAQMAIAWVLRNPAVTTALIGASRWEQIEESIEALGRLDFTADELTEIDRYALDGNLNLWAKSSDAG
jgi:L-glyceraldehyde 3-phosphate reductase